ncbi:hypothetical protein L8V77_05015 [Campylobacter sp. IFREMER_LSEM_CL2127]|uniref:hypothetical protein n=1 Tax=Campylobacter sp. IFREMER_LSEM_CL2127 TaxID=2911619 RepID=UPI0021E8E63D|nr:hypothetical protein [Campylobacter sp. IFREMER_LSEM_CL2127]MCV3381742.1 hypothetical protein [Campylobacter sp. IFREMER_LSEM_CL2127]
MLPLILGGVALAATGYGIKKWYDKTKENDVFKNNNKSFSMQDNKKTYTASDFYKPNSIFNEKQDTLNNNKSKEDEEIAIKMEAVFGKQF